MKDYKLDGFLIHEKDGIKSLCIESDKIDESIFFMQQHKIKSITINKANGYFLEDTQFLQGLTFIERVHIGVGTFDISGIYYLPNLKSLSISREDTQTINFTYFPLLEECGISWRKGCESLFNCQKLQKLLLGFYKEKDLTALKNLNRLMYLDVRSSSIESLKGIENLTNLEKLDLNYLRKLKSIDEIGCLTKLKKLYVDSCKKIVTDFEFMTNLTELEILSVRNGGVFSSISSIKYLDKLQIISLIGYTQILDGDVTPLIGRKDVIFSYYSNYTHTNKEIDMLNGSVRAKNSIIF
jgi:Leucine-rich repeat (LRR) protein